jgi:membrane protein YqaA with SNARE-associated domain
MNSPATAFTGRLRGLKAWVEGFAGKPSARWSLFCVAFVEASCFPLPPDALLVPMGVSRPQQSFTYAAICTAGSIAGGFLGYLIGYALFETAGRPILELTGALGLFEGVLRAYRDHGVLALIVAGFTPVPFKIFTIAAGFNRTLSLGTLAAGLLIGRSARFFLLGTLLYRYGGRLKVFLDLHFEKLSLAFACLVVAGVIAVAFFA